MKTKKKYIPKSWEKEFLLCSPNDLKFLFLGVHNQICNHYKLRNPDIASAFTSTNPVWHIEQEVSLQMHKLGMKHTKKEKKSWKTDREILNLYTEAEEYNYDSK